MTLNIQTLVENYKTKLWLVCKKCGKYRWVYENTFKSPHYTGFCIACGNKEKGLAQRGANHANWKGGRGKTKDGYIIIKGIHSDNFFYPMVNRQGSIYEHRLVMARCLNRCLLPWEIVHHRNGIRDDNRSENLALLKSQSDHLPSIITQKEINRLTRRVTKLEQRVIILEAENAILQTVQEAVG